MKYRVHHWMGNVPPCESAVRGDDGVYTIEIDTIDDLMRLCEHHTVAFRPGARTVVWLDDRGQLFSQR